MSRIWRTLKGYLFWTYERGSFHYDVMVSLILIFVFVGPHFINFKDQPAENLARHSGMIITANGHNGFVCQVEAAEVDAQDEVMVRSNLLGRVKPVIGPVVMDRMETIRDRSGHIIAYRAWVHK
jgi:hypothetical protein